MRRLSPNYFEFSFIAAIIIFLFFLTLSLFNFQLNEEEIGFFFLMGAITMIIFLLIMYFKLKRVYLSDDKIVIKRLFSTKAIYEISFSNLKELEIYDYIIYKSILISFLHSDGKLKKINFELGLFNKKMIPQLEQISESCKSSK